MVVPSSPRNDEQLRNAHPCSSSFKKPTMETSDKKSATTDNSNNDNSQQEPRQKEQQQCSPKSKLKMDRHAKYFSYCLRAVPRGYERLDVNRMTLVHFCIQSLDLIRALPSTMPHCLETNNDDNDNSKSTDPSWGVVVDKENIIDWIYNDLAVSDDCPGFMGGNFVCPHDTKALDYVDGHVAHSYAAMCTLATLGNDLERINRVAMSDFLRNLQDDETGRFSATSRIGSECDLRFTYCACAIAYMMEDWSGIDCDKAMQYILSCRSHDGAFALHPGQEGHGGSTFCAVASLLLLGKGTLSLIQDEWKRDLISWCVHRQVAARREQTFFGGMQGRPNKVQDSCYSYWVGGTLVLLGRSDLLDTALVDEYCLSCQDLTGGFSKFAGGHSDILHSFYSLAWLSLSSSTATNDGDSHLKAMNCTLGIPAHVARRAFPQVVRDNLP